MPERTIGNLAVADAPLHARVSIASLAIPTHESDRFSKALRAFPRLLRWGLTLDAVNFHGLTSLRKRIRSLRLLLIWHLTSPPTRSSGHSLRNMALRFCRTLRNAL